MGRYFYGIANLRDTDSDNDLIPDALETNADLDGDQIPNFLDNDTDGDSILDLIEGNEDVDNDSFSNFLDQDSDADTFPDSVETDVDGDGIADFVDVDDGDAFARTVRLIRTGTGRLDPLFMLLIFVWGIWRIRSRISINPRH